jgi:AraC-like DNA-binding protein
MYRPSQPLADFVEFLWASENYHPPRSTERVLPTGAMDLIVDVTSDGTGGGTISGPRSTAFLLNTATPRDFIGARFATVGGFAFFGSAGALRDLSVPLETFWGPAATELRERLIAAPRGTPRFALFERFLRDHLDRDARSHPAVRYSQTRLWRSGGSISVGALAEECGLSQRYLIELFHDQVGLTPKLYARLRRFRRTLVEIKVADEVDWADLAVTCGYSDQPHLVHEFQAFSGMSPSAYLRHRTAHVNHLRDPD